MWTRKVSLVPWMSSKTQTSPTFNLLSLENAFHPEYERSNLFLSPFSLIKYLADQNLPFNILSWISPTFWPKSKCFFPNLAGILCQGMEKKNVNEGFGFPVSYGNPTFICSLRIWTVRSKINQLVYFIKIRKQEYA